MFPQSEAPSLLSVWCFSHTSSQKYNFFCALIPLVPYANPSKEYISVIESLSSFLRERANFRVCCRMSSLLISVLTEATATCKMSSVNLKNFESSLFHVLVHVASKCNLQALWCRRYWCWYWLRWFFKSMHLEELDLIPSERHLEKG